MYRYGLPLDHFQPCSGSRIIPVQNLLPLVPNNAVGGVENRHQESIPVPLTDGKAKHF